MSFQISDVLRKFVSRHIKSLEQLETLLFLQRKGERYWSAGAIGSEIGASADAVADCLEQLASLGLLDVKIAQDVLYRFNPATAGLKELTVQLEQSYRDARLPLLALIVSRERDSLRAFSDAFRLRPKGTKDTDEGKKNG